MNIETIAIIVAFSIALFSVVYGAVDLMKE